MYVRHKEDITDEVSIEVSFKVLVFIVLQVVWENRYKNVDGRQALLHQKALLIRADYGLFPWDEEGIVLLLLD